MNIKIKITAGIAAGLIAGTALVGTAFAAPSMMASPAFNGNGMMRSALATGHYGRSSIAGMQPFMDRYRTPSGAIDFNRMHGDVASGTVTMPHVGRIGGAALGDPSRLAPLRGSDMMNGLGVTGGSGSGYGMTGSTY